jgi:3-(3-hydroxy-phenyl)propionate hydroxylase
LVVEGKAPPELLDTYSEERVFAAEENLLNSTRSTDFITPKSKTSLTFRNAVLSLARDHAFARALVNSGRLSVPSVLTGSRLNTPDDGSFAGDMVPGAPMDDAPMRKGGQDVWLLDQVGQRFCLLVYVNDPAGLSADAVAQLQALAGASAGPDMGAAIALDVVLVSPTQTATAGLTLLQDHTGRFAERFDTQHGSTYLIRPDQHVAARWRAFDAAQVQAALARATCNLY